MISSAPSSLSPLSPPSALPPTSAPAPSAQAAAHGEPAAPADAPRIPRFARLLTAATHSAPLPDPDLPAPVKAKPGEDVPTDGLTPEAATAVPATPEAPAMPTDAAALLASLLPLPTPPVRPLPPAAAGAAAARRGEPEAAHPGGDHGPVMASESAPADARGAATRPGTPALASANFADTLREAGAQAAAASAAETPKPAAPELPPLPLTPAALPTATTVAASAPAEARIAATPGSADFATQLGAQLSTFVRDGVQHARLELHPLELGPVTVQIQLDGNTAQVNLAAEQAPTRAALEQALPQLAGSLREAGLTLTGGGVFEQPRDNAPGNPGGRGDGSPTREGSPRSEREAARESVTPAALAAPRRRGVVDLVA